VQTLERVGSFGGIWRTPADLEVGDTAGLETCATKTVIAVSELRHDQTSLCYEESWSDNRIESRAFCDKLSVERRRLRRTL
jgi:hypothetical protein